MCCASSLYLVSSLCLLTSLVQIGLAVLLSKKGLRQKLPIFFAYNIANAAVNIVLTIAAPTIGWNSKIYFYLYWLLNLTLIAFEFGIMYEAFVHAVKPYSGLIDLAKMLFGWAGLFLLLAAGLTALSIGGSAVDRFVIATAYLERGLRMMQCGLLILFFLFERRLGLSWRSPSVCAALGLGTVAATGLTATFFITRYPAYTSAFDIVNNGVYLAMVSAWVLCFRLPQPARKNVLDSPSKLIFQRWNEALMASPFSGTPSMAMAPADPFLPGVEKTVDRILARKMVS